MPRHLLTLVAIAGASFLCGPVSAQQTGGNTSSSSGSAANQFYQSQVFSGVQNSGQSGTANVPYYVDPSRFQYNRPSSRNFGNPVPNQGRTYNFRLPPGYYQYGYCNVWNPYCGYYYGRGLYFPRVYQIAPGVTEHVGPFIPVR